MQYFYYGWKDKNSTDKVTTDSESINESAPLLKAFPLFIFSMNLLTSTTNNMASGFDSEPTTTPDQILGSIFAWTSATLYVSSRVPQIIHNVSKCLPNELLTLF